MNVTERILIAGALMATSLISQTSFVSAADPKTIRVYFGTYGSGKDQGIFVSELDRTSGRLSEPRLAAEAVNPSFLAIHPTRKFLYAVGEISDADGKRGGGVSAFAIDPKTGKLTLLNQHSSEGAGPCHVVVDATGRDALVANYSSGSAACLPIGKDGKLSAASAAVQHKGSSVNPGRQKGPHAHSINLDAANRFAFVADLGLDKIMVYRFDPEQGTLVLNDPPSVSVPSGGGPRHFAFHPNGHYAYTNNEMASTVTAFRYDPERGVLTELQTISTLPDDFKGDNNTTAEIRIHPNGRFVYVSNRGHDSIAIFTVDPATGRLTKAGHTSTGGKVPRNFNLDPSGAYLLAANQDTHNVVVFRVNQETGQLEPTGSEIKVPSPVCVRFVEI